MTSDEGEGLWEIVRHVVEQDGRGDYLEMGDQCIYCSWTGRSHAEIVHDKNCIITKARELIRQRKRVGRPVGNL